MDNKNEKNIKKILIPIIIIGLIIILVLIYLILDIKKDKQDKLNKNNDTVVVDGKINTNNDSSQNSDSSQNLNDSQESSDSSSSDNVGNADNENNSNATNKMTIKVPELVNNDIIFKEYHVIKTPRIMTETLKKLFSLRGDNNKIWNGLKFVNVEIVNKVATIKLSGVISGNISQINKMKKEIEAAGLQFSTVNIVKILVDNNIIYQTQTQNNNNSNNNTITQASWTPCGNAFSDVPQQGNASNSTFIGFDYGVNEVNGRIPISNGFHLRGCISKAFTGTYATWAPFEGQSGYFEIKDNAGNVLSPIVSGSVNALMVNPLPGSQSSDWMEAVTNGEDLYFDEVLNYDFSSVSGQNGTIIVHSENAAGLQTADSKTIPIVFN